MVRPPPPGLPRTLTGDELGRLPFAQRVVLLCVQRSGVLGVGRQVEQRVLGEAGGQAQLLGVGALDGEEESVAGDFGPRREPRHDGAVLGDVAEVDVCRSVGLCVRETSEAVSHEQRKVTLPFFKCPPHSLVVCSPMSGKLSTPLRMV